MALCVFTDDSKNRSLNEGSDLLILLLLRGGDRETNSCMSTMVQEAQVNKDGNAAHSSWRNYDDINEYFWYST